MKRNCIQTLLLVLAISASIPAFAQAPPPDQWVKHVVIIVQENRTPDNIFQDTNLFGTGADILPAVGSYTIPAACNNYSIGGSGSLSLVGEPLAWCANPNHDHDKGFIQSYDDGTWHTPPVAPSWDDQCHVLADHKICGHTIEDDSDNYTFAEDTPNPEGSYEPGNLLSPYFQIAEQWGFSNYFFSTQQGPSFIGHQFLFSGTSAPEGFNTNDTNYELYAAENPLGTPMHLGGCASPGGTSALDIQSFASGSPMWPSEDTYFTLAGAPTPGYPCYNHASMANLLDPLIAQGNPSPWKYYIQSSNYDNSIWTAPNALVGICGLNPGSTNLNNGACQNQANGDWGRMDHRTGQILADIQNCNLPSVSWVTPDGNWSDHPGPGAGDAGPSWVEAIVNAIGGTNGDGTPTPYSCNGDPNKYWSEESTVIFITWDDWGGWFDHVPPYNSLNGSNGFQGGFLNPLSTGPNDGKWFVYGFRVPLLVMSKYTPAYISGSTLAPLNAGERQPFVHDFGSVLGFVESAFDLTSGQTGKKCGIAWVDDNLCNYPYADYFSMDGIYECTQVPNQNCDISANYTYQGYPLFDFFSLPQGQERTFTAITGAKYPPTCFVGTGATGCFQSNGFPSDPDDE